MRKEFVLLAGLAMALFQLAPSLLAQPQGITTITFDGMCDGLTLNVGGTLVSGTHNNWDCAGGSGNLTGIVAPIAKLYPVVRQKNAVMLGDSIGPKALGCAVNYYVDFSTNKWSAYSSCAGEPETLVNLGKFSIATSATASPAGRSLLTRASGGVADESNDAAATTESYTIKIVNQCDLFYVTAKGAKAGAMHDLTGCTLSRYTSVANTFSLSGEPGSTGEALFLNSSGGQIDNDFCTYDYLFSLRDLTWIGYASCLGNTPFEFSRGTITVTPGLATPTPD